MVHVEKNFFCSFLALPAFHMFKDYSKRSKESSSGGIIKVSMRPFTTLRKNCLNSKISFLSFTETPAQNATLLVKQVSQP